MTLVVKPTDVSYDMVEHPHDWVAWRRGAMGIELNLVSGWTTLVYKYECAALPKGTSLSGTFEYDSIFASSNGGLATNSRYRFTPSGTFETCEVKQTILPIAHGITNDYVQHSGRYEVDGYTIHFTYNDGTTASLPFFFDPARPTRMWLESKYFPNPSTSSSALCVVPTP